jgi:hypothetical protein
MIFLTPILVACPNIEGKHAMREIPRIGQRNGMPIVEYVLGAHLLVSAKQ